MKNYLRTFFVGTSLSQDSLLNLGWLLFRLHIGLSIAIHAGWPKINGSSTPDWFIKQVGELGFTFPSPGFWAMAATWGEFAGGLMLAAGFLTRLAALQLAFQFLVIAFLWYEKPEPLTGMYFQQLLMWCYVLATFVGGGRYAVDRWIRITSLSTVRVPTFAGGSEINGNTRPSQFLKKSSICILVLTTIWSFNPLAKKISMAELTPYCGIWKGVLRYTDYGTGRQVEIPSGLQLSSAVDGNTLLAFYSYPTEPVHNSLDSLVISAGGQIIDGGKLIFKRKSTQELKLVTQEEGMDDNQNVQIRFTYVFNKNRLVISKEVKGATNNSFFLRNEYRFTR